MITFNNQDISFTLKNKILLKKWINTVIEQKSRKTGNINFSFCSDHFLLDINKKYLNHNTFTDIITFDYSKQSPKQVISGDIFISINRIEENAKKFSKTFGNELHRVMIHGVLHLLGYTDKTKLSKAEMTKQEDLCLQILDNYF
jgi:rRNA maturation RNase YbeY